MNEDMKALQVISEARFETIQRVAAALFESKYFKANTENKAQAIVKVMAGDELGIQPFASMSGIHVISGKPTISANLIATLVKNDPRYDYRPDTIDDDGATLTWFEDGEKVGQSAFTFAEAERAGLAVKSVWKQYPSDMCFARAISRGARRYAPGIFGGAPIYTPEEIGGEVIEGDFERVTDPDTPKISPPRDEGQEKVELYPHPDIQPPPLEIEDAVVFTAEDVQPDTTKADEVVIARGKHYEAVVKANKDLGFDAKEKSAAASARAVVDVHRHEDGQVTITAEEFYAENKKILADEARETEDEAPTVGSLLSVEDWQAKCLDGRQNVGKVCMYASGAFEGIAHPKHAIAILEKHYTIPATWASANFKWNPGQSVKQTTAVELFKFLGAYASTPHEDDVAAE